MFLSGSEDICKFSSNDSITCSLSKCALKDYDRYYLICLAFLN